MASKDVEVIEERKETWKDFLYNPDKGTVLGRTGISWFKITVFYIFFYLGLAGWFAGLLHAFYSTLDETAPRYYGENSLIQDNPALGVRPMPIFDSTMIRFSQAKMSSYRPYVDHLEAFVNTYEQNTTENLNCSEANGVRATDTKACNINIKEYLEKAGCNKENGYGFFDGKPCVVLKMNKLFGFVPEAYANRTELDNDLAKNEEIRYISYGDGNVGISCDGQNGVDKQYIEEVKFWPEVGLEKIFFPYKNQKGYRSPVIVAKFEKVEKAVTIQVNCRLWAKNIDNSDGKEKRGTVHFEMYIG